MLTRHASRTEPFKWWLFIEILVNTSGTQVHTVPDTSAINSKQKTINKQLHIIKIQYTINDIWAVKNFQKLR